MLGTTIHLGDIMMFLSKEGTAPLLPSDEHFWPTSKMIFKAGNCH